TIDGKNVAVVGNGEPDFRVGWANNFRYKDVGLTSLFDWQQGSNVINLTRLLYDFGQNAPDFEKGADRLKTFKGGDARPYVESATFLKLREVSVYYQVPESAVKKIGAVDSIR